MKKSEARNLAQTLRGKTKASVGALPLVAAMIGQQTGVEVIVGGTEASTNGRRIHLPWIDNPDEAFLDAMFGYLWHEGGHIKFTDFEAWRQAATPLERSLLNVLEDIREEKEVIRMWPGAAGRLYAVSEWLVANDKLKMASKDDHPAEILGQHVLNRLRVSELHEQCLVGFADAAEKAFQAVFPHGARLRLDALLSEVDELTSTADCLGMARNIVAMLKDEQEKEEQREREREQRQQDQQDQQDQQQQDGGDAGQPDAGSDDAGSDDAGSDGSDAGQGSQDDPNGDDAGKDDKGAADGHAAGQDGKADPDAGDASGDGAGSDGAKVLAAALKAGAGDLGQTDLASLLKSEISEQTGERGVVSTAIAREQEFIGNPELGKARLERVRAASGQIRQRLVGLVQSKRMEATISRRGRSIDSRRMVRAVQGDPKCFVRKEEDENPNTAIHLLVDRSGSMRDRISMALDAAMALAVALERIEGCNVAVTAFPASGTNVVPLKKHGETIAVASARFSIDVEGSTPMGQAMWYAIMRLARLSEPKKLMIVVTDGQPNETSAVLLAIKEANSLGITTIGIGIGVCVDQLFPVAITINDVSELKGQLFKLAHQIL